MKKTLSKRERERAIINSIHFSIRVALKINILDVTIESKILASDVYWRMTGSQIF